MKNLIRLGAEIPVPGHATSKDWVGTTPGTTRYPGRNHPRLGQWLVETFCPYRGVCADPMIGAGGLWLNADVKGQVQFIYGCDVNPDAVWRAKRNVPCPSSISVASAETWRPPHDADLVMFSPPYPQAHSAGKTAHQIEMRERQGLHAMQEFAHPFPDLLKVYKQVREYCVGRMLVIVRNRIVNGEENDWIYQQAELVREAGWDFIQMWWRHLERPTGYQQWKLARDPNTPWIRHEWVIEAA